MSRLWAHQFVGMKAVSRVKLQRKKANTLVASMAVAGRLAAQHCLHTSDLLSRSFPAPRAVAKSCAHSLNKRLLMLGGRQMQPRKDQERDRVGLRARSSAA
ncbi:hypothetical protein MPL3365_170251 [Mesorhizobium plurifarium]|uniref:Uncharacterized protein n=1 Tax=Mesorhizobium plurifarium TaxID=69974 RepID=A0A090GTG1_MESPL|nr:hypothetical protein MPL3365_170251 [Mesorhizobium plurifarium]